MSMCLNGATLGTPARMGDKVVVELREWQSRHTNPEGEIIEVLGVPDAEGVDMLSVLRQYELAVGEAMITNHRVNVRKTAVLLNNVTLRRQMRQLKSTTCSLRIPGFS